MQAERYHNQMTEENFEQFVVQHRVTWEQLQRIVRRVNHSTADIFDPEISIKRGNSLGFDKSDWDRANESMQESLRKLHLLKIPLHYDTYGKLYIIRQECGEFLFDEQKEKLLTQLNEVYGKWIHARNGSKNKEQLEKEYDSILKHANSIMHNEFTWSERNNRYFEFALNDNARWLDSF